MADPRVLNQPWRIDPLQYIVNADFSIPGYPGLNWYFIVVIWEGLDAQSQATLDYVLPNLFQYLWGPRHFDSDDDFVADHLFTGPTILPCPGDQTDYGGFTVDPATDDGLELGISGPVLTYPDDNLVGRAPLFGDDDFFTTTAAVAVCYGGSISAYPPGKKLYISTYAVIDGPDGPQEPGYYGVASEPQFDKYGQAICRGAGKTFDWPGKPPFWPEEHPFENTYNLQIPLGENYLPPDG